MNVREGIRIAFRALGANKLRAALTMLGVIIGVAAVVALLAIGRGAQLQITSSVESLGTNLLFVTAGAQQQQSNVRAAAGTAQTLTFDDAQEIEKQLGGSLLSGVSAERVVPGAQLIVGGQNLNTRIVGATPQYETVHNFHVDSGSFITDAQLAARDRVIVLGANVAAKLFPDIDPTGQTVRVSTFARSGAIMRVVGIMESKGGGVQNLDDQAFVPLTTVAARLQPARNLQAAELVSTITVSVMSQDLVDTATEAIGSIIRQRHRVAQDDFTILSQRDFLQQLTQITGVFTAFLGAIAGISLVVGGIGIMNIMLVSVTERTREIGIRKAVGARARDILSQFLVEAIVVSVLGGALGIGLGATISFVASRVQLNGQTIPSFVSPDAVLLAFSVAAAIGLFFGIYPAMRAARLNPIDALRYE